MNLPDFDLYRPDRLADALDLIGEDAVPYCGGTELLAAMGMGLLRPDALVSLRKVPELRICARAGDTIRLGATVTHREVARSPEVASGAPLLANVARRVGNVRVRSTGTIGGNLAFAEPRSDVSTALMALGATIVAASAAGGERRIPIREFVRGAFDIDLRPEELIVAVEVPAEFADLAVYRKVVFSERPVVGVAVTRERISQSWRVVVGAVGEQAAYVEVPDLAEIDPADLAGAIEIAADVSGSEGYKRHLAEVTIRRAVAQAGAESMSSAA